MSLTQTVAGQSYRQPSRRHTSDLLGTTGRE
jgi:hypothetical protein